MSRTIEVSDEQYELLKSFKSMLVEQDVRCTSDPVYVIEENKRVYGVEENYSTGFVWYVDADDEIETNLELFQMVLENCKDTLVSLWKESKETECEPTEEELKQSFLDDIEYWDDGFIYEKVLDNLAISRVYYREEHNISSSSAVFSLFEKDAKNYCNHDSANWHTYAVSSYRSKHMNELRKLLIDLKLE